MAVKITIALLLGLMGLLQPTAGKTMGNTIDLDAHFEHVDSSSQERVVGGYDVPDDEYVPYQVSMQFLTRDGKQRHFCGGSLIAPNRVLTAAHCVNGQNASRISVVAGIRDLNDSSGYRSQVKSYEMNENYEELVTSDLAILKIEPAFELDGKRVGTIDVGSEELVGGNQEVLLTGWGSVFHFGTGPFAKYPTILQKLAYKTMENSKCKETMSQLTDTEVCALERFGKGACNGDSGGPLVMTNGEMLKQVGIVSYGTAFCASNSPDVYTRVSVFTTWLKERMA